MKKCLGSAVVLPLLLYAVWMAAQSEQRTSPGNGPYGVPEATFTAHRLGNDHDEGIATIDMNGDGRPDLLSGAIGMRIRARQAALEAAPVPHSWSTTSSSPIAASGSST